MLLRNVEFLFADLHVRPIENLRYEVQAIGPEFKLDQVRLAVLHLVQRGSFLRVRPDIRELVVVPDRLYVEWRLVLFKGVSELHRVGIIGAYLLALGFHFCSRGLLHFLQSRLCIGELLLQPSNFRSRNKHGGFSSEDASAGFTNTFSTTGPLEASMAWNVYE